MSITTTDQEWNLLTWREHDHPENPERKNGLPNQIKNVINRDILLGIAQPEAIRNRLLKEGILVNTTQVRYLMILKTQYLIYYV